MLDPRRLRVLREVARQGSFSSAAEALDYTQSAVSQQIARLEAEVGMMLIERRPRGLRLTAAGEALVEHADAIMARLAAAEAELEALTGLHSGRLRMASFPTAGATLIPLAVANFRAAHPAVELTLVEGEPEEILPRLEDGELDVALLFEFAGFSQPLDPALLERVDLLDDDMYVALPPGHRLAERRAVRLADLRDEAWVQTSVSSPCARHVVRACHGAGFEPRVSFESDDYLTVQGLVAAGVGVALIPGLALTYVRPEVVIRDLSPRGPFRRVLAAAARSPARAPATEAMLEVLRRIPGSYQPPGVAALNGDPFAPPSAAA